MDGDDRGEGRSDMRGLGGWVALNDRGRAPLVLSALFWGTFLIQLAAVGHYASLAAPAPPPRRTRCRTFSTWPTWPRWRAPGCAGRSCTGRRSRCRAGPRC
ncbi:hypothetical protein ACFQXA_14020 [Nocardiopsis composta]